METPALSAADPPLPFEHAITAAFQPIVRVQAGRYDTVAVEALARGPRGSRFAQPLSMFDAARQRGRIAHLDRRCIEVELAAAAAASDRWSIFLNVHPQTLHDDPGFPAFLVGTALCHRVEPTRLTLEVLEHGRVEQPRDAHICSALRLLRGLGVRIAVDDVAGAVDALRAGALHPDYLKLDATLLRDARYSLWARDVLRMVVDDAAGSGVAVIAEGVETEGDLALAAESGITLMQGFLLGAPQTAAALAGHDRHERRYGDGDRAAV